MLHSAAAPAVTYLKDYTPFPYHLNSVDLTFELGDEFTLVHAKLQLQRGEQAASTALVLPGEELELREVKIDGKILAASDYQVDAHQLTIPAVPANFTLEITTRIKPQENTALSGLYRATTIFCTQCEAQGFRRITYFPDRPDVLAPFVTTIIADKTRYPILLSNGNAIARDTLADNRHSVTWRDPFNKPCYLFALVAGDLDFIEDEFVTQSGRKVVLQVFVDKGQQDKASHAMESIKKAMRWDEIAYGREYDLDIFMVVAIDDFNMGAMENKGLNIFNSKYILAKPDTATDIDYEGILLVVGHEYFHNWSGNRVTCRDWFQLSLKEGLTVFREQEFTADMTSHLVERINTVRTLRNTQFREDGGPLAHPVQPDSYIEINNFYTATVYNKGAEVIRMIKTLLGAESFRKGMDLYFARHDGCAVTIEDFVKAMEDASGHNLTQFRRWYHQAGTPELTINSEYNAASKEYTLTIQQTCAPTPQQPTKLPFHIPLAMGLLNQQGQDIPLQLKGEGADKVKTTRVLEIKNPTETFCFVNVPEQPVPSLLRKFSAPVKLNYDYSDAELNLLAAHDSDGFNRWEISQKIAARMLLKLIAAYQNKQPLQIDINFVENYRQLLQNKTIDKAFLAELLLLPSETYLGELLSVIDPDAIYAARRFVRQELAQRLKDELVRCFEANFNPGPYVATQDAIAQRRLKNTCLSYLMLLDDPAARALCYQQYKQANNMTDQLAATAAFANTNCPEREEVLNAFYQQWQKEFLVIDKWFGIQARSELPNTLAQVKKLMAHPAFNFKNPNNVRALIGVFANENQVQFHAKNGEGYAFLREQVLALDKLNPQIAARLLTPMTFWRRYDSERQQLMRKQLEQIMATKGLSKDVYEIAAKSLG